MSRAAPWLVALAVPVALLALNVRLLASEGFLRWEYGRTGFPAAAGFTDAERLAAAVPSTRYLVTSMTAADLAALEHDGAPLYTEAEIEHLVDVKRLVRWLQRAGLLAFGVTLALLVARRRPTLRALEVGGWLTVGLVLVIGLGIGLAWRWVFVGFHQLFFEAGTWQFPYESGLIRLFPNRFWYDTAAVLAALTAAEGALVGGLARWRRGRS